MKYSVGVDIGGTNVALAVVKETGSIVSEKVIPTNTDISPEEMIENICEEINNVIEEANVAENDIVGIGVGAPGPLDSRQGYLTNPPNLIGWVDVPIQQLIEKEFSYPVTLENDANAAALAEKWVGAAQENDHFVYITISTGIGAGVITDGKLLRGLKGNAADIGHTVVDPLGDLCNCGQRGCLEAIASGTAIAKHGSKMMGKDLTTKEVFNLYEEGHEKIKEHMDYVLKILGIACVNTINTFDPEKLVIGGGVSKAGEVLFEPMRSYVRKYALNPTGRQTEIVPAKLDQNSGVIGAAALCFDVL